MSLPKDFVIGLILLAICGWMFYLTTGFETDLLGLAGGMSAKTMPRLVLGSIACLAVLMIVQGARAGRGKPMGMPPWKMWATAGVLAVAAMSFETVGVPLAFFAVCVAVPVLWGARNKVAVGVFAVALPAAIYLVFQGLLGLRLPLGPLSFLAI